MQRAVVRSIKTLLPKGTHYRKLLLGPAAGCVMPLDFGSQLKAYLGLYEYELHSHFKKMVKPGASCFDIGGRDGYHALTMARLSRGKVASFECDHEGAEHMRRVFAQNRDLTIQVVESYVGAENGPGHITIDRASQELFPPDFIKMDIEGAEDIALEGASDTLERVRPCLIIEVHGADKEEKCLSKLRTFHYNVTTVDQGRFLKDPARGGYNRWLAAYPATASA